MENQSDLSRQFAKFALTGGICVVVDYAVLIYLTERIGINYMYSGGISYALSILLNYLLSIRFVYESSGNRNRLVEMAIFTLLGIIAWIFNQMIMWITVNTFHIYYAVAKILATLIVSVYNFVSRKVFLEESFIDK